MKRILVKEGTTVGLANGILKADDKKIYSAENLKMGLFKYEKSSCNWYWSCILFRNNQEEVYKSLLNSKSGLHLLKNIRNII